MAAFVLKIPLHPPFPKRDYKRSHISTIGTEVVMNNTGVNKKKRMNEAFCLALTDVR